MRSIKEINADISNIPNLYKEREEVIVYLYTHGYSVSKIATLLNMKQPNVSALLIKLSKSL